MIQIKRNKFLTKIINNEQISSIPTKAFDEITGVGNLEYAKEFIRDKDLIMSEIKALENYRLTRAITPNTHAPNKILIDDKEISFKKLLESWDLTYDILCSAIKNATLLTINNEIQCDNYEYIDCINKIANSYIQRNIPFEPKKSSLKLMFINRSIVNNSKYIGLSGTRILTTSLTFVAPKNSFHDDRESINIYNPDEKTIENLIDTTDKIYFSFSLFYNDEEWYFQELSRESIERILSKCREFAQQISSNPPNSIMASGIFQILWYQSVEGLKSGTIVLQDIWGHKKRFAVKDLIPKPKYLLQQYMGKYLSTKTSKWREDVSNYIL